MVFIRMLLFYVGALSFYPWCTLFQIFYIYSSSYASDAEPLFDRDAPWFRVRHDADARPSNNGGNASHGCPDTTTLHACRTASARSARHSQLSHYDPLRNAESLHGLVAISRNVSDIIIRLS